jgi:hypothetical protein
MTDSTACPAAAEELQVAEGLLESAGQSDQRMPRKVPIALTLLVAFAVSVLVLGRQSRGVVANAMSKVGFASTTKSPADAITTFPLLLYTQAGPDGDYPATGAPIAGRAAWVAPGACVEGPSFTLDNDLHFSPHIKVPATPGIYELCYQHEGAGPAHNWDLPTVQTGQVCRAIAASPTDKDAVDETWGNDYSALMAGKSLAEIKALDKIIRRGGTDPHDNAMVTWLKLYHEEVGGKLPASADQAKKLDMACSKMFAALAKKHK